MAGIFIWFIIFAPAMYTKHNHLKRVSQVQSEYLQYSNQGVSDVYIHQNYIYPKFLICIRTMYTYLSTNVRIESQRAAQVQAGPTLFG